MLGASRARGAPKKKFEGAQRKKIKGGKKEGKKKLIKRSYCLVSLLLLTRAPLTNGLKGNTLGPTSERGAQWATTWGGPGVHHLWEFWCPPLRMGSSIIHTSLKTARNAAKTASAWGTHILSIMDIAKVTNLIWRSLTLEDATAWEPCQCYPCLCIWVLHCDFSGQPSQI